MQFFFFFNNRTPELLILNFNQLYISDIPLLSIISEFNYRQRRPYRTEGRNYLPSSHFIASYKRQSYWKANIKITPPITWQPLLPRINIIYWYGKFNVTKYVLLKLKDAAKTKIRMSGVFGNCKWINWFCQMDCFFFNI